MTTLAVLALLFALQPALFVLANLIVLRTPAPPSAAEAAGLLVSILIPARNEADNIGPTLAAALASRCVAVEIVVGDDQSTDDTAERVHAVAARDPRVRLVAVRPLPPGWSGKANACAQLAEAARGSHLLFVDADVRLAPGGAGALAAHARRTGADLVSGVPRQVMRSVGELLTVPLINLLLLGYLPVWAMRRSPQVSLAAGCGQLVLVEANAYRRAGGHGAVRMSLHDGVTLPRAVRAAGLRTDLVRGADLATCRMYRSFPEAWAGFAKNAHEGMATPRALPVWTLLLVVGHLLPWLVAAAAFAGAAPLVPSLAALGLTLAARLGATLSGRESALTVLLHPATVLVGLALQWRVLLGRRSRTWKGRTYPGAEVSAGPASPGTGSGA